MKDYGITPGYRIGRLTAVKEIEPANFCMRWECVCDCGGKSYSKAASLANGHATSCGCAKGSSPIHGDSRGAPEYRSWGMMHDRCRNPNNKRYGRYGGRGISVCDRWSDYQNFLADMGRRPPHCSSIDRIDNDGNYEPGNCRWATAKQQTSNRGISRLITWRGEVDTLGSWAKRCGLSSNALRYRVENNWPLEEAMTRPPSPLSRPGHHRWETSK